jgi:hypothetical protein
MTSDQILKGAAQDGWDLNADQGFHPNMLTEVAQYRMTVEVACQLALLNEQIGGVLNSRIPQMRVMVESGDWPLQVRIQEGSR